MQIGEFAKICNTNISLLRHYDKVGVLVPAYTDKFTGYRHYSEEQVAVFKRISTLKQAGFSLQEIKHMLESSQNDEALFGLFEKKKEDIKRTLLNLDSAKKTFVDGCVSVNLVINESDSGMLDVGMQNDVMNIVQENILNGNREIPFENDDIIGKWQVLGEYAVKEDFYDGVCANTKRYGERIKELYFLPCGKQYWCYSWTRGKLLTKFGGETASVNEYTLEDHNGDRYMFVNMKTVRYRLGGKTTVVVLKRIDNTEYTIDELARCDNIDLPFVNDEAVVGKWKVFDFCRTKEDFNPLKLHNTKLFWTGVEFQPGGDLVRIYNYGKRIADGRKNASWTKGYILDKNEKVACAYEIQKINGVEYLFVEWKTGDYVYGGIDPQYYVFVRYNQGE